MAGMRGFAFLTLAQVVLLTGIAVFGVAVTTARAQTASEPPATLPETTIEPASGDAGVASSVASPAATSDTEPALPAAAPPHHKVHHVAAPPKPRPYHGPIDPAQGRLTLKQNSWAYADPDQSSSRIEAVEAGKFINVTGLTRYFARVALKSGAVGYIPLTAIELAQPTDKMFKLTKDTPVLSEPSHYGKKLAEVHNGHDVHVVGVALNYMKIRMKDGLEGYITTAALE